MNRKFWEVLLGLLVHVRPSHFFRRILRCEALVYKSYFCQNSRSTEIIRRQILIQSLPTRHDGVENCDKVYRPFLAWISSDCFQSFSPLSNWDEIQARPLAAYHSRGTKSPYWDANVALGQDKQRKLLFKIMYALCWSCPSATFAACLEELHRSVPKLQYSSRR